MSQLLTYDTSKRTFSSIPLEHSSITLEHSSPSAIYPLKDKNLLFIEHTDYQFSPISFTIYNAETGEQFFHTLKELNPRPHYLEHVRQMDNRRLMMILSDTLIIYDLQTKKITNKTTLSEDYVSDIWVNP
ncbi:TPA: hypothetical protein U1D15_001703 [Streptococcus suis]|nr:hypothetical protein [Streptococcus suis]